MVYDRIHFTLRLFLGVCLCFLVVVVFYCACVDGLILCAICLCLDWLGTVYG